MSSRPITRLLAGSLVLLASIGAATSFSAGITGPTKGDPALGKKMFKDKCIACHKVDGSGGVKVTGNPTPDWRDAKRMNDPKYDDDYLRDCITNGKIKSGMVAWSKQGVKPAQIENLIAFIRTFSAEKKPAEQKK
jgi:mono/diheme cytochrome c family protein